MFHQVPSPKPISSTMMTFYNEDILSLVDPVGRWTGFGVMPSLGNIVGLVLDRALESPETHHDKICSYQFTIYYLFVH
jgi:hypothetical protein